MNKVFLDLETTGLNVKDGDRIIELCCLKINKSYRKILHYYINPETDIKNEAYLIHGINNDFLKNKHIFKDIIIKFLNFIYNSKIIIHNANFDLRFLNFQLKKNGYKELNNYCYKIIDTLKISRNLYKNKKNSLDSLCKRFNIDNSKRIKHSAILDVNLLSEVYFRLIFEKKKLKFSNDLIKNKKKQKILNSKLIFKKSNLKKNIMNNFTLNKIFKF